MASLHKIDKQVGLNSFLNCSKLDELPFCKSNLNGHSYFAKSQCDLSYGKLVLVAFVSSIAEWIIYV